MFASLVRSSAVIFQQGLLTKSKSDTDFNNCSEATTTQLDNLFSPMHGPATISSGALQLETSCKIATVHLFSSLQREKRCLKLLVALIANATILF